MTTALSAAFTPATLDYVALLPVLIIFSAAMLGVLVEAFVPRTSRYLAQVTITLVGIVAAMAALAFGAVTHRVSTAGIAGFNGTVKGSVVIDGPALFLQGALLLMSFIRDTANDQRAFLIALLVATAAMTLPQGFAIGFVAGTLLHYLPTRYTFPT